MTWDIFIVEKSNVEIETILFFEISLFVASVAL